ncbi:MAG: hypothetical protein HY690_17820 [Chloroflexi bacterium]|nr:hypothetical protein [Chloroflexota bacterium]
METIVVILVGGVALLFLIFAGVAVALLAATSLAGLLGGVACLLDTLPARIRRSAAPEPRPTD